MTDITLPATVHASPDMAEALRGAEAVVVVTPSVGVRSTTESMRPHLGSGVPVVVLSKGIEDGSLMLMTEVLEDVLGGRGRLAGLSGPNHAEEVGHGIPSATVVASYQEPVGKLFQELFMTRFFRVYTNPDVVGVELCGASKNVIAVAAGMSDGLGYGDNTKAALLTRGLAELTRLGIALGGNPLTFSGLAGMGDLVATCTSTQSRNRTVGVELGKGRKLDDIVADMKMVAEGVKSTAAVLELAQRNRVEMPIAEQVGAVLYEGKRAEDLVTALMLREAKAELHGIT
jgi:glycerol-3-phosphate dehydrogenase (NAD(P)+)